MRVNLTANNSDINLFLRHWRIRKDKMYTMSSLKTMWLRMWSEPLKKYFKKDMFWERAILGWDIKRYLSRFKERHPNRWQIRLRNRRKLIKTLLFDKIFQVDSKYIHEDFIRDISLNTKIRVEEMIKYILVQAEKPITIENIVERIRIVFWKKYNRNYIQRRLEKSMNFFEVEPTLYYIAWT